VLHHEPTVVRSGPAPFGPAPFGPTGRRASRTRLRCDVLAAGSFVLAPPGGPSTQCRHSRLLIRLRNYFAAEVRQMLGVSLLDNSEIAYTLRTLDPEHWILRRGR